MAIASKAAAETIVAQDKKTVERVIYATEQPVIHELVAKDENITYVGTGTVKAKVGLMSAKQLVFDGHSSMQADCLQSSGDSYVGLTSSSNLLFQEAHFDELNISLDPTGGKAWDVHTPSCNLGSCIASGVPGSLVFKRTTTPIITDDGVKLEGGPYKDVMVVKIPGRPLVIGAENGEKELKWHADKVKSISAKIKALAEQNITSSARQIVELYYNEFPNEAKNLDPNHELLSHANKWTRHDLYALGKSEYAARAENLSNDPRRFVRLFCVLCLLSDLVIIDDIVRRATTHVNIS